MDRADVRRQAPGTRRRRARPGPRRRRRHPHRGRTVMAVGLLAPDPALPMRDELLAPDSPDVEVVRCKYRVGESLRVLYRRQDQLLTVRATADGRCRWWRFPDDRRLDRIGEVTAPSAVMRA